MSKTTLSFFTLLWLLPLSLSAPLFGLFEGSSKNTASVTTLSTQDLKSKFLRAGLFSRVAYCDSKSVETWDCGLPCEEIGKGVNIIVRGGDDGLVPMYFVARDPTDNSIVVTHQGTDPSSFLSILNDAKFLPKDLDTARFKSAAGKGIKVHDGFQQTFERTADEVLASVKKGLADFNSTKVRISGHSLGAAVATLDGLMLKQELDKSIDMQVTVFGMPRSGNQNFADFVDATFGNNFARISNQNDPVPRVPPRLLGFRHASGEVHIKDTKDGEPTEVVSCPGQENENCADGGNPLALDGVINHLGPYFDNLIFREGICPK